LTTTPEIGGVLLVGVFDLGDVDAVFAALLERDADVVRIDLGEVTGRSILEGEHHLGASLEVDRPVHVVAARGLVDEQGADGDGHQHERHQEPRLELRDEVEVVSRREQVAELVVLGHGWP
jgi:hypothetical protein